jgi:peptidoglycan hydrolase CwlO-like protein
MLSFLQPIANLLTKILTNVQEINMKTSQLASILSALADKADKIHAEVAALRKAFDDSDVEIPAEAEAALTRLEGVLTSVDNINLDEPVISS